MRAVRYTPAGVQVVNVAEPDGDGVVVEPYEVGICGSDLHVMAMGPSDITPGHEIAARLDGRPVAIQPMAFCGTCDACQRGDHHVCAVGNRAVYGMHLDGGLADRLLVDPQCIVELPDGLDPAAASLVEPVAVGVHAVNLVGIEPGMRVAVIGAGTVGLVAGAVARSHGVDVDIACRHAAQAGGAERLGLGTAVSKGYDLVIDAAGTDSSIAQAIKVVRPAGTVLIPGIYWGDVTMPGLALGLKEVRLVTALYWGHHHGEREIDLAARLLARLPELPDALVTHRFPLDRAVEAFATAADKTTGAIKVTVEI
ncbi:MAG: zinc-binding dehydrogenase [Acidimicrobiales bacterium]